MTGEDELGAVMRCVSEVACRDTSLEYVASSCGATIVRVLHTGMQPAEGDSSGRMTRAVSVGGK